MSVINTKDTKVSVAGFQVDKNVIYYGNSAINTNNISMISISPIPANYSWILAVIMALGGLLSIKNGGWLAILVAAIWIIAVVFHNINRGENLAISLNSGNTLYFHCRSREFLGEVVTLITECIKSGTGSYTINFDRCAINKGVTGSVTVKV